MFSLDQQTTKFTKWNARSEFNGDTSVPASDMMIAYSGPNTVLSDFDPTLRSFLYRAPHPGEMDLADQGQDPDEPTRLRFPKMKNEIKWEHQIVGATVTVEYGTGGPSSILMADCTLDSFVFDPQDGGTVNMKFRIQCHPDSAQASKLYELNGNEITLSINPPSADQGSLGV
jgi:hypothetical protein